LHGELFAHIIQSSCYGFDVGDYSLYKISVQEWNGCVFIALSEIRRAAAEIRSAARSP